MAFTTIETPWGPLDFSFNRRRYGRQFYCWAEVVIRDQSVSLGDPWPASTFPRAEMIKSLSWVLAGKVIVPAAVCEECREFKWHRQGCSQWTESFEVSPGCCDGNRVAVAHA